MTGWCLNFHFNLGNSKENMSAVPNHSQPLTLRATPGFYDRQTKLYPLGTGHVHLLWIHLWLDQGCPTPPPMYAHTQPTRMTNMDSRHALVFPSRTHHKMQGSPTYTTSHDFKPLWILRNFIKPISVLVETDLTDESAGCVEEFTYISFFCDSDSDRLCLRLLSLRPIMWIWCSYT